MGRSKSSHRWLSEHNTDEYVKRAQQKGYRSRAVFKLEEIQEKDQLLKPGMTVLDLGAAPGGWSQYAAEVIGKSGRIIALDILPIEPLPDVTFIQGDFTEEDVFNRLLEALGEASKADLVISDMAPNMSGMKAIDQPKAMYLAELALDAAVNTLKPGGSMLVKLFQGAGVEAFQQSMKSNFKQVLVRKPKASRQRSREFYLLGRVFKV